MEAPKGVYITATEGGLKATCRRELELQSTDGEVSSSSEGDFEFGSCSRLTLFPFIKIVIGHGVKKR